MVVHGIPGPYELKRGDVLSIDVGVVKDGWVADAAITVPIGSVTPEARKLLDVTKASLFAAVEQMRPGNHLGDVSAAVQRTVEIEGLSIIRTLVGHGIGREMHEEPQVPNFGEAGQGPAAGGGDGAGDRADGQRGRPFGPAGRRRLGGLLSRTALWPPISSSPSPSPRKARASSPPGTRTSRTVIAPRLHGGRSAVAVALPRRFQDFPYPLVVAVESRIVETRRLIARLRLPQGPAFGEEEHVTFDVGQGQSQGLGQLLGRRPVVPRPRSSGGCGALKGGPPTRPAFQETYPNPAEDD